MRSWRREPATPPPGDPATMEEVRRQAAAGAESAAAGRPSPRGRGPPRGARSTRTSSPADDGRPVDRDRRRRRRRDGPRRRPQPGRLAGRRGRQPRPGAPGAVPRRWSPASRAFPEAAAILDECHLAILAVPDDALAGIAATLHLYSGQAIVHTSGLHGADVLAPALAAGTSAGSFHPLVAFADLDRALAALPGATVAIEGDDALLDLLAEMATSLGAIPVRLAPGLQGRLPRRRRPGRRRPDGAPRRGGRGRRADRPRRGGRARGLRPARRTGARQRAGAGHRPGPDRPGGPRRRRHDRGPPRRGRGGGRRGARRLSRPRPAPGHPRRAARSRTGSRGPAARGVHKVAADAVRSAPCSAASRPRYAVRPVARFATVAAPGPRAPPRPRSPRPVPGRRGPPHAPPAARARPGRAPALRVAGGHAGPRAHGRRRASRARTSRSAGPSSAPAPPVVGRAPRRRRGAAEARHRHLRRRDRHPVVRRRPSPRRRASPAPARRRHLDAAQGNPEPARDARGDGPAGGRRGDRAPGPPRWRRSRRSSTGSSRAAPASTRPSTTG